MATRKKRPNKAKSIVAQPLFRSRQERPGKGKGSYKRNGSPQWEPSSFPGLVNITEAA
ncbi:alternative ribosome rescue factor ArfA [Pseudomonas sp. Marseille-Q5115]|uniref:alternative ribosome rescue factor ArfA n=1 Tax=Pseudomonas sp. Marseille-Q5115 TaxID=2866593 RepID=UPI001CE40D0E|nr:alternative ribosome rescue factor ArfA [Pseudomonas sp. Marseille-Q5115]